MAFSDKSVLFGGTDEYVTMGSVAVAFERTDLFSFSVWFKSDGGGGYMVSKSTAANGYGIHLWLGAVRFLVSGGGGALQIETTNNTFDDNAWHHAVVTQDGSVGTGCKAAGVTIYVDGVVQSLTTLLDTCNGSILSGADFNLSGRDNGTSVFVGYLDEVAAYDKVLNQAEVTALYHGGSPNDLSSLLNPSNLVGWWRMGDGDTFPTLTDNSTNSSNGTMTNMEALDIVYHAPHQFSVKSALFNGVDEYVTMGNVLGFEYTDPFSLSVWVKTSGGGGGLITKQVDTGTVRGYYLGLDTGGSGGKVVFIIRNDQSGNNRVFVESTRTDVDDGQWHLLTATWNGSGAASGAKIYVDGTEGTAIVTDNLSATIVTTAHFNLAARDNGSVPLAGSLDEAAVYNAELSESEVKALFGIGQPNDLSLLSSSSALVGWWRMGDGDTSPTITDHGGSNDGTMTNMDATNLVGDAPSTRFSLKSSFLNGSDEYVTMGDVLGFDGSTSFSISAWIRSSTASTQMIVTKQGDTTAFPGYIFYLTSSGEIELQFIADFGASDFLDVKTTAGGFADGNWHHVCVTYQGGSLAVSGVQLYVDGVAQSKNVLTDTLTTAVFSTTRPFCIGTRLSTGTSALPFNGHIDDVAVYDKELSANEVWWIWNGKAPRDLAGAGAPSNLVGWWRMGDGDTSPTITDHGGSNDGTMTNMDATNLIGDGPVPTASYLGASSGMNLYDSLYLSPLVDGYGWILSASPSGPTVTDYFKMRCRDSGLPAPGYVSWTVTGAPDDDASEAPLVGVASDIVVTDTWQT